MLLVWHILGGGLLYQDGPGGKKPVVIVRELAEVIEQVESAPPKEAKQVVIRAQKVLKKAEAKPRPSDELAVGIEDLRKAIMKKMREIDEYNIEVLLLA
jgi:hypothetical protein